MQKKYYKASDYAALIATRTELGRSIRSVGEAAIKKATKPAPAANKILRPTINDNQHVCAANRYRYIIGCDPGVSCGIAIYDTMERKFLLVDTTDFWGAIDAARAYEPNEVLIVVEVAHHAPTFRHLKAKGQNVHMLSKIARNVGQVTREAQLLAEGLRRLGYKVIEKAPFGKKKGADGKYSAEADRREFEQLTGWTGRTSQHARDAARLAFYGNH